MMSQGPSSFTSSDAPECKAKHYLKGLLDRNSPPSQFEATSTERNNNLTVQPKTSSSIRTGEERTTVQPAKPASATYIPSAEKGGPSVAQLETDPNFQISHLSLLPPSKPSSGPPSNSTVQPNPLPPSTLQGHIQQTRPASKKLKTKNPTAHIARPKPPPLLRPKPNPAPRPNQPPQHPVPSRPASQPLPLATASARITKAPIVAAAAPTLPSTAPPSVLRPRPQRLTPEARHR